MSKKITCPACIHKNKPDPACHVCNGTGYLGLITKEPPNHGPCYNCKDTGLVTHNGTTYLCPRCEDVTTATKPTSNPKLEEVRRLFRMSFQEFGENCRIIGKSEEREAVLRYLKRWKGYNDIQAKDEPPDSSRKELLQSRSSLLRQAIQDIERKEHYGE